MHDEFEKEFEIDAFMLDGDEEEEAEKEERQLEKIYETEEENEAAEEDDGAGGGSRVPRKVIIGGAIVLGVILVSVYIVSAFFNRADIEIDFQKQPWSAQGNFVADKAASSINTATNVIPAQVFSNDKNITQTFPASSFATVSEKAHGTIIIYNNFSAASQDLVATTRFVTPDGKVFRITNNVTVPGAQVVSGKTIASSIQVPIVADAPGPDYNIGPVAHLSIPGFQGSPRYTGFYGVITASTTGGFTGRKASPSAADIADAKAKTTAALQASLQGGFAGTYPNNFKLLDGATSIQMTKLVVNTSTDQNGNFSVFGEATLSAVGFDEAAFKTYLLSLAQKQEDGAVFNALALNYSNVKANFPKGQVSFTLSAQATLEPSFSADDFRASIAGKSITIARSSIAALPGLADGKISVWPFWLWSIPSNTDKIHVTAN